MKLPKRLKRIFPKKKKPHRTVESDADYIRRVDVGVYGEAIELSKHANLRDYIV